MSGGLNLDFNADWGRLAEVLPAGVNEIPRAMSDQLPKIKMRGTVGDACASRRSWCPEWSIGSRGAVGP